MTPCCVSLSLIRKLPSLLCGESKYLSESFRPIFPKNHLQQKTLIFNNVKVYESSVNIT